MERDRNAALISEIDRIMKKHTDNLMNDLKGVTSRLLYLEKTLLDELQNNHGITDGKLRHIANSMREMHASLKVVKDKQELLEAQLRLSRLEISNRDQQSETRISGHMDSLQQVAAPRFPFNTTPISQHDSYYQPSSQHPQPPALDYFYDQPDYLSPSMLASIQQPVSVPHSSHNISSQYEPSPSNTNPISAPLIPHDLPTGSGVGGGSGSSSSNGVNRVSIDDVINKVTSMGFASNEVRSTVKKLTENGQTVDLNVVLDKLMTDEFFRYRP